MELEGSGADTFRVRKGAEDTVKKPRGSESLSRGVPRGGGGGLLEVAEGQGC